MFKSEIREKTVVTQEEFITVDESIINFCEWLYRNYGKSDVFVIIRGIRNRYKSVDLGGDYEYDELGDDEIDTLFIEYSKVAKND